MIARAKELIETQLGNSAQMRAIGAKPIKGVIFTGAPGTGKTHLARIIANVADAQFYLVSGPTIVSKYVGDSEETLRMIFAAAQSDKRAIIFFDEIDSIASSRETDTNGVGKRLVAQLLTLMDGFESKGNVVVVAATNRIEDVDPALLRPGRFDWQIPFPMPSEHDRLRILQVQAASLSCEGELPLTDVAERTELERRRSVRHLDRSRTGGRQGQACRDPRRRPHDRIRARRASARVPRTSALGASSILGSCLR